jgi:hypothetical protein
MIAQAGNDLCPLGLRNEWLSPCAASTRPSVGLEICASCATRGTCIRTHLLPTACREAAITSFGDHPNASITRCIAGCLRFFTLIQAGERPVRYALTCDLRRARTGLFAFLTLGFPKIFDRSDLAAGAAAPPSSSRAALLPLVGSVPQPWFDLSVETQLFTDHRRFELVRWHYLEGKSL